MTHLKLRVLSQDCANIVLMGHDVSKIVYLKKLATATVKTIKFNIVASLLINFYAILLKLYLSIL